MDVRVVLPLMRMDVHVVRAPLPANEQTRGKQHDDQADQRFGRPLHDMRQVAAHEQHRKTEGEQRGRMAKAPGSTEPSGCATGAAAGVGDERGDGNQMVGIGRVAKAEYECEYQDEERPVTGGVTPDEAVDSCHWTIHFDLVKDRSPAKTYLTDLGAGISARTINP